MGRLRLALAVIVATGLVFSTLHGQTTPTSYLVLVKSQNPSATAAVAAAVAERGTVVAELGEIGVVTATSSDPSFAEALGANPDVQSVAIDRMIQWLPPNEQAIEAAITPGADTVNAEPFWAYQWNIRQIHADQTAGAGYLGLGARVVILDAGIITTQPDLAPNLDIAASRSFVPGEELNPPPGVFNHGSHVAGIIAGAVNNVGVQGVAPKATIIAVKVLSGSTGSGEFGWLIQGLEYAASIRADVANMSLGATFDRINAGGEGAGPLLSALNRAINHATQAGVLCVSAAGNEAVNLNSRLVSIPAQSGNGMAVAATGPFNLADFDRPASYTNYGRSVVNVAAPGGDFASDAGYPYDMVISPGGYTVSGSTVKYQYYFAAGTSMAAPHVSGLAALIVGKYGHIGPTAIKTIIENSAVDILKPGADPYSGKGRIDAWKALQ